MNWTVSKSETYNYFFIFFYFLFFLLNLISSLSMSECCFFFLNEPDCNCKSWSKYEMHFFNEQWCSGQNLSSHTLHILQMAYITSFIFNIMLNILSEQWKPFTTSPWTPFLLPSPSTVMTLQSVISVISKVLFPHVGKQFFPIACWDCSGLFISCSSYFLGKKNRYIFYQLQLTCVFVCDKRVTTLPAEGRFSDWKNMRTSMFWFRKIWEWFVPVWQNSYSDYSVLVKFTH